MKHHMMVTKLGSILTVLLLTASANICLAEDEDYGSRVGEARQTEDPNSFRVCAPRDNLPYSNEQLEGFENKIAEVLAKDLNKKVEWSFWYDRQGFYRNTLNAYKCDVVIGTATEADITLNSKPYYRSGYVFVYKKSSGYNIKDYDSPDLHKAKIGVIQESPPTRPLSDKGLLGNSRPYRIQRDLNLPPSFLIDDLVKGDIDVAIVWGPIGGYFAKQSKEELVVVPVPEYEDINEHGKSFWNISVGVRKKDKERLAMIEGALERRKADIIKILDDYGIPHVPIVEEKKL
ncbi:MAG TPA: quinoprotein dehydrogenase-associated putative ABC transporter substrate-binding protein [Methylophilaceae bacterium]|jgi:mxaJ protein